jgi:thiol-disulfide isomerase/thioredoxin
MSLFSRRQALVLLGAMGVTTSWAMSSAQAISNGDNLPEFQGIETWLNGQPLTTQKLKGNVVAVQFWTLGCINCQRTLPSIVSLNQKYADKGLVIVGVHTPEFSYEREINNIKAALKKHDITYPVAVDNGFQTWRAYQNEYWPHLFLADKKGRLRYDHIGEGAYKETDQMVQKLLAEV